MSYHRRPQTQQERRLTGKRAFLQIDDYRIKIRPNRNSANLPNSWDDLQKSIWGHRTWKRHRLTQYKVKEIDDGGSRSESRESQESNRQFAGPSEGIERCDPRR